MESVKSLGLNILESSDTELMFDKKHGTQREKSTRIWGDGKNLCWAIVARFEVRAWSTKLIRVST